MALSTMHEGRVAMGRNAGRDRARAGFALTVMLLALTSFLGGAGDTRAAMYKWVDEKGVVHYTDKMPPEAVDKANVELNKQGVPVKKTEKAMTPEQRAAIEQAAARDRESARAQEQIARRDRALVSSYTSEAEIDLARNRSLQTINNVIVSSQAFTEQLEKRKVDVEARKVEFKGKPAVAVLDRERESIDGELARQAELIAQKKREAVTISAKYDADKQRWRELVAAKTVANKSATAATGGAAAIVPTGGAKK